MTAAPADEYVLDTPTVRAFIAGVRSAIAGAASPDAACDAIRPAFSRLLADSGWLAPEYARDAPESGMGGGIGQWLLFRAGDRSLTLFSLVVPAGSQTPVHDHLAWGLVGLYRGTQDEEIYAGEPDTLSLRERRALEPGDFYALLPPRDDIHRVTALLSLRRPARAWRPGRSPTRWPPPPRSTVIDLEGETHYAELADDLPPVYREVAARLDARPRGGRRLLRDPGRRSATRDVAASEEIWDALVPLWDDRTFYGFLATRRPSRGCPSGTARSSARSASAPAAGTPTSRTRCWRSCASSTPTRRRPAPASSAASSSCRAALGRASRPSRAHWPAGTSLRSLHGGAPRPASRRIARDGNGAFTVTDAWGDTRTLRRRCSPPASPGCSPQIACDEALFPHDHWTAIDRTHYMESSKTFVMVDRPFWQDKDPRTGRDVMSMTLTDRMTRGTYLLDDGPDRPAVICLSYTWMRRRAEVAAASRRASGSSSCWTSLGEDLPRRRHPQPHHRQPGHRLLGERAHFLGAFKGNLPGHYRYNQRHVHPLHAGPLPADERGIFLAGDDISWTPAWVEGAVQTALNAVWGVMHHLGGGTDPDNPGPGDVFDEIAPIALPD